MTRPLRGAGMPEDFAAYYVERFYSDLLVYAVIAGASMARDYAAQVRERERDAHQQALERAELERHLVEARLQGLRAQLHPHFLFNALNTISAFTETDPPTARRLMGQLDSCSAHRSRCRQAAGHAGRGADLPRRLPGRRIGAIRGTHQRDRRRRGRYPRPYGAGIPAPTDRGKRHPPRRGAAAVGWTRRGHGQASAAIVLRVRDDGVGVPADWSVDAHAGVGLKNAASRLEHLYRRQGLLTVQRRPEGGLDVTITIPSQQEVRT